MSIIQRKIRLVTLTTANAMDVIKVRDENAKKSSTSCRIVLHSLVGACLHFDATSEHAEDIALTLKEDDSAAYSFDEGVWFFKGL